VCETFDTTLAALETGGGLASFQRLGGHVLIALDRTEYFCIAEAVVRELLGAQARQWQDRAFPRHGLGRACCGGGTSFAAAGAGVRQRPRMAPRSSIARLVPRTADLQPMGLNMHV